MVEHSIRRGPDRPQYPRCDNCGCLWHGLPTANCPGNVPQRNDENDDDIEIGDIPIEFTGPVWTILDTAEKIRKAFVSRDECYDERGRYWR